MTALALVLAQAVLTNGCPALPDDGGAWTDDISAIDPVYPDYPPVAAGIGATGVCWISYHVDANGRPTDFCTRCRSSLVSGVDRSVAQYMAQRTAEAFADESRLAIAQWRYGAEHSPYRCVQTTFASHLEDQGASDLPPDPDDIACLEFPRS